MEKITIKEVNKYLSTKGKIIATGKYSLSLTQNLLQKFKKGCKKVLNATKEKLIAAKDGIVNVATNVKDKVKDTILPDEETITAKVEEKVEGIEDKKAELQEFIEQMEQDDEYRIGVKNCYLKEVKNELKRLENKKIKVTTKGLGVFALTKLTLSKMKENIKNKWAQYREKVAEKKAQRELEKNKQQLIANIEKLNNLQQEEQEILNKYPELSDPEKISFPVTSVRKPSEEEKESIKKSSKYKKALATLAIIAGLAIGSNMLLGVDKDIVIDDTKQAQIDDTVAQNTTIEEKVEEQSLKLGDYLNLENGSTIYETSTISGNHGVIGQNGYSDDTLFKVNAVTYIDQNNNEVSFNLVQKDEKSKKQIEEEHKQFVSSNQSYKVKSFHVTPCDEMGIPYARTEKELDLGGWTNMEQSKVQTIDTQQVISNTYELLGGKVL